MCRWPFELWTPLVKPLLTAAMCKAQYFQVEVRQEEVDVRLSYLSTAIWRDQLSSDRRDMGRAAIGKFLAGDASGEMDTTTERMVIPAEEGRSLVEPLQQLAQGIRSMDDVRGLRRMAGYVNQHAVIVDVQRHR